ncbi:hypothetical protein GOB93_14255 [Acetobacter musti]|uniref:Bbp19-like phage domain-containing protein n=1 Tax=Acetobacter musti TaxID=864732 RepID=A0ABX0JTD5_9PROT|nr:hypothetical protein [Acetobacter musti]NHN85795.1 hypothetical protein [Acetobacter musti]
MTYDPNDVAQVEEKRSRRKAKATGPQRDLLWVCSDPRGRRVLARILQGTGPLAASFIPGDALGTAYREGQRSVGIELHSVLTNAGEGLAGSILAERLTGDDD